MQAEAPIHWFAWLLVLPGTLLLITTTAAFSGWVVATVDRGEPAEVSSRTIALIAREAAARTLILLTIPVGWFMGRPQMRQREGERQRPTPVLLVPPMEASRGALLPLRVFLVQRGWMWAHPAGDRGGSTLAERAAGLAVEAQHLQQAAGGRPIEIVAHGTGGLVAAWYVKRLAKPGTVRRLVTLGTPWQGTRMAVFQPAPIGVEALHGAPVLDGLVSDTPTISVWSAEDTRVIPASSALPDGVGSVAVDSCGHFEMLFSTRVYRAVEAALTEPLPTQESA